MALNPKQSEAVTAPANGRVQIVAGPGTGKTKVLVSRVAQLLLVDKIPPHRIIVTTFTKKAANEMIERLTPVLQDTGIDPSKILMGTFHSICFRIIKKYGGIIGLNDYRIADDRDSTQVLQDILKNLEPNELEFLDTVDSEQFKKNGDGKYHGYDVKAFKRQISKLKCGGITVKKYDANKCLKYIYEQYQNKLQKERLLDFDDCLLECHRLIKRHPVLSFVQHVLVDEFQDTNEIQLQLMYEFSRGDPKDKTCQHNVTVVGDPDQSIYAFRDAQAINFKKMIKAYESLKLSVTVITLQENYRSTKDILGVSESIMRQQSDRVSKNLSSQYKTSFKPVHRILNSSKHEAKWIGYQILYLKSLPKLFKYNDIAILVRAAYQTRMIENELVRLKIPYSIIKGKAFWERKEVVSILDYLRAIANPSDRIAYMRTINFPKRGVGEKTLELIYKKLELGDSNVHDNLKVLINDLSKKAQANIQDYLLMIEEARDILNKGQEPNQLEEFFEFVYVKSGIKEHFKDETHEQNIMEVQNQLLEYVPSVEEQLPSYYIDGDLPPETQANFLGDFITSLGLFEHVEDVKDGDKVSISTIHGAKGLEWPVVLIPGVCEGLLPAHFAMRGEEEDINEERRCFYVATTRAKMLLYMSSYLEDGNWSRGNYEVSRFLNGLDHKFSERQQCFRHIDQLKSLYSLRGIEFPDLDIQKFYQGYKEQWEPFSEGELTRIQTLDYKPVVSSLNLGSSSFKADDNFPKFSSSFASARQDLLLKRQQESDTKPAKRVNGPKSTKSFNAPRMAPFNAPRMKAPDYSISKVEAPKGKKAPFYIPNRAKP